MNRTISRPFFGQFSGWYRGFISPRRKSHPGAILATVTPMGSLVATVTPKGSITITVEI